MDGAEEAAMDLKDEQWAVLAPLLPERRRRGDGRGRPWRAAAAVAGPSPAPGAGQFGTPAYAPTAGFPRCPRAETLRCQVRSTG